jgi:hypothetical protein
LRREIEDEEGDEQLKNDEARKSEVVEMRMRWRWVVRVKARGKCKGEGTMLS